MTPRTNSSISACSTPDATSSIGTISGGSLAILGSPSTISVSFANALRLSFDRALARLRSNRFSCLSAGLLSHQRGDLVHVDAGVPEVEVGHPGEALDRLAVRTRHSPIDRPPLLGVKAPIPARHREAGHQPLHVPLERSRQRLVEIVDAEHQPPIGPGESTEVGQMRIATELHVKPAPRRTGQIRRHRVGRAAEERERRHQHPPVADRHQLLHPRGSLLLQQLDRITPIGGRLPVAMPGARRHRPRRLAPRRPLRGRGVGDRLRLGLPPVALGCPDRLGAEGVLNVGHGVAPFAAGRNLEYLWHTPSAPSNRSSADGSSSSWDEIAAGMRIISISPHWDDACSSWRLQNCRQVLWHRTRVDGRVTGNH